MWSRLAGRSFAALRGLAFTGSLLAAAGSTQGFAAEQTLRIGYQKYGALLLLKESGALEAALRDQGVSVTWREFPGGPQLLEALNVGAIDFGTTGEAPPIFAQAAGAPLVYVGVDPAAPRSEAILVPKDSPIRTVAELKGHKVALNKGSNVHYLLVRALEEAGLTYGDIQPVYLAPADARAAFERGAVDAWAIWDPYYAAAVAGTQAKVLADGQRPDGGILVPNHEFYLATRSFNDQRHAVLDTLFTALKAVEADARGRPADSARRLSPAVGIPVPILETAFARMGYGVEPLTPDVVAEQQRIADTFYKLHLIPKPIAIGDALPGNHS